MSRVVVISNRVALPDPLGAPAAGGLAVAVNAALKSRGGVWFGWSGKTTEDDSPPGEIVRTEADGIIYALTDLTKTDLEEYYNGFANRVLWPILHYRVDLAEFSRAEFRGYMRVNQFFADCLMKVLQPDDIIWVHDYHLMPLAKALRERGITNRIGFFLHIPCPPPDILQTLPRHEAILGALVHYNLIGFQTESDSDNFARYLAGSRGAISRVGSDFRVGSRRVSLGTFPVGIDFDTFRETAVKAMETQFIKDVHASVMGRALIIGVDRLDYSKGIAQRFEAFDAFLAANQDWHDRTTLLQIAPKSRSVIPEYAEIDEQVSALAGRINGAHGHAGWVPIRYVNRNHERAELAGLYRSAAVGLVTPLRDGMNLVAKEYIAAQNVVDPGVLVLSRFAGAAAELNAALLVNPFDREGVALAIRRALEMRREERVERVLAMMAIIASNQISRWAEEFIARLMGTRWADDGEEIG